MPVQNISLRLLSDRTEN